MIRVTCSAIKTAITCATGRDSNTVPRTTKTPADPAMYAIGESDSDDDYDYPVAYALSFSTARPSNKKVSHVLFVVDVSGSMSKRDVATSPYQPSKGRLEAVMDCCRDFVQQQLQEGGQGTLCSMVTFNNDTTTEFLRRNMDRGLPGSIVGVGNQLTPAYGTNYLCALRAASDACEACTASQHVVLFLSDGRPGDLHHNSSRDMDKLYAHMDQLQASCSPGTLLFHAIGFGPDEFIWLRKMAAAVGGQFHDHAPKAGAVALSHVALQSTFRGISTALTVSLSSAGPAARAPGLTRGGPLTQHPGPASRPAGSRGKPPGWRPLVGDLFVWSEQRQQVNTDWQDVQVTIYTPHFAEGAARHAYHMRLVSRQPPSVRMRLNLPETLVAKETKQALTGQTAKAYLRLHLKCLSVARDVAEGFDARCRNRLPSQYSRLEFIDCHGFRCQDAGVDRYLFLEEFLSGPYTKYNDNNGYVCPNFRNGRLAPADHTIHEVAHAFSHFSWVHSGGDSLVCDIQGVGTRCTDPQVHSLSHQFGDSDLGPEGIRLFFSTHRCNAVCRALNIAAAWPRR